MEIMGTIGYEKLCCLEIFVPLWRPMIPHICLLLNIFNVYLKLSHPSNGKEPTTITAKEGNDAIGDTPTHSDSYQETSGCSWTG